MREVAQWLAHLVWDQGAAGSSPVFPTIFFILYYTLYTLTLVVLCNIIKMKYLIYTSNMSSQEIETVTKINIEDTSSHQTEVVEITNRPEADMMPERANAIKIPLDNVIKK